MAIVKSTSTGGGSGGSWAEVVAAVRALTAYTARGANLISASRKACVSPETYLASPASVTAVTNPRYPAKLEPPGRPCRALAEPSGRTAFLDKHGEGKPTA